MVPSGDQAGKWHRSDRASAGAPRCRRCRRRRSVSSLRRRSRRTRAGIHRTRPRTVRQSRVQAASGHGGYGLARPTLAQRSDDGVVQRLLRARTQVDYVVDLRQAESETSASSEVLSTRGVGDRPGGLGAAGRRSGSPVSRRSRRRRDRRQRGQARASSSLLLWTRSLRHIVTRARISAATAA